VACREKLKGTPDEMVAREVEALQADLEALRHYAEHDCVLLGGAQHDSRWGPLAVGCGLLPRRRTSPVLLLCFRRVSPVLRWTAAAAAAAAALVDCSRLC
jgi:hypothetical protein